MDKSNTIIVPTIMHSGTHLLRHVILKGEGKNEQDICYYGGSSGRKMITFHLTECDRHREELDKYPIFTSLRHPRRIAESFARRAKFKTTPRYPYNEETFDLQFRELIDNISTKNPVYLHVDHEIRDKEVKILTHETGLPLKSDWSVNKSSGSVAGTHNIDIDQCPEVKQEYIDFYYYTIEKMNER